MSFRITGLSPEPFRHLFGRPESELADKGVQRYTVDSCPNFPDRIEMQDVAVGETVLLLNHTCQPANSPYHASHAIFIREGATQAYDEINSLPEVMSSRLLSLRGFDDQGMMQEGEVAKGEDAIRQIISAFFANPDVEYIHAHNAKRGCYSGRIDRA